MYVDSRSMNGKAYCQEKNEWHIIQEARAEVNVKSFLRVGAVTHYALSKVFEVSCLVLSICSLMMTKKKCHLQALLPNQFMLVP